MLLIPMCYNESNITESSIRLYEKCSSCWNILDKNYNLCSKMNSSINPFMIVKSMCIDTLILLIILYVSFVIFLPLGLWYIYSCIKRHKDDDTRYIIDRTIII